MGPIDAKAKGTAESTMASGGYASTPVEKAAEQAEHREYYLNDRYYTHYLNHPHMTHSVAGPHFRRHLDAMAARIPQPVVVDVGCGGGVILTHLLRAYPSFVGIGFDLSYEGAYMGSRLGRGRYFQGDAEAIGLKDAVADLCLHIATFHHFFRCPDQMLYQTWRVLKPGGLVLLLDPNPLRGQGPYAARLKEIRRHLHDAYEGLASLIEEVTGRPGRLDIPTINMPSEKPISPETVEDHVRRRGFEVLDRGFVNDIAFLVRKFSFGYEAGLALDEVLASIAPREASQFYFVLRRPTA